MKNALSSTLPRRGFLSLGLATGVTLALASEADAASVGYSYQLQATQSWCSAASSRIALTARDLSLIHI